MNECTTRRIIIIQQGKENQLFETEIDSERNYYVFTKKKRAVANGKEQVHEYLNSLNYQYGYNESKYFYIFKSPIKLFDDFNLDDKLKERISLIALPGSDTINNKFSEIKMNERSVYEKLLNISSSFIFINKGRAIKNKENHIILRELYMKITNLEYLNQLFICY